MIISRTAYEAEPAFKFRHSLFLGYFLCEYYCFLTLRYISAVVDILLWKDEKKTFTYFLVLVLLFYWFFLGGSTLISSAAKLLLLLSAVLFGYGILPSNM